MVRGTTPVNRFRCMGQDLTFIDVIYITYMQNDQVVLEKTLEDCDIDWEYVQFKMTQEETLLFSSDSPVQIQIRGRMKDGTAFATNIVTVSVSDILKDGVI